MTAGRGWIALVLVVFAGWRPLGVLFGALLFGGVNILQLHAQGFGLAIPSELLSALPYAITILVLVLISRDRQKQRLSFPLALAKPFRAED
jgi:simple sugar transport system permease protein